MQFEHGRNDLFDASAVVHDSGEVPQVSLTCTDVLGQVCGFDSFVTRYNGLRVQRRDCIETGDPGLATFLVGLRGHHVHSVVDDVACDNRRCRRYVQDGRILGVTLADRDGPENLALDLERLYIPPDPCWPVGVMVARSQTDATGRAAYRSLSLTTTG